MSYNEYMNDFKKRGGLESDTKPKKSKTKSTKVKTAKSSSLKPVSRGTMGVKVDPIKKKMEHKAIHRATQKGENYKDRIKKAQTLREARKGLRTKSKVKYVPKATQQSLPSSSKITKYKHVPKMSGNPSKKASSNIYSKQTYPEGRKKKLAELRTKRRMLGKGKVSGLQGKVPLKQSKRDRLGKYRLEFKKTSGKVRNAVAKDLKAARKAHKKDMAKNLHAEARDKMKHFFAKKYSGSSTSTDYAKAKRALKSFKGKHYTQKIRDKVARELKSIRYGKSHIIRDGVSTVTKTKRDALDMRQAMVASLSSYLRGGRYEGGKGLRNSRLKSRGKFSGSPQTHNGSFSNESKGQIVRGKRGGWYMLKDGKKYPISKEQRMKMSGGGKSKGRR